MKLRSYITTVLLLAVFFCSAQVAHLRSGDVIAKPLSGNFLDSFYKSAARFENKAYAILQFSRLPGNYERKTLESAGIHLLEYIPDSAYTVLIEGTPGEEILFNAKVYGLIPFQPKQKMDRFLGRGMIPSWAVTFPGTVDVLISVTNSFPVEAVISFLENHEFQVIGTGLLSYGVISIRVPLSRLNELASLPAISYIQVLPPADKILNRNSRNASRASLLNAPVTEGGKGLNGEGVVVGIGDNADVQLHVDFTGRLINRTSITSAVHGTHTTGTLAGAGIVNEVYRGYASKAVVVSQVFSGILNNAGVYAHDYGMVLTNNSYGNIVECDYNGTYDLYARILDQKAFEIPTLQHVFAAGNSGGSTCTPYPPGFHTVLGSYQSAKNVLTVGASSDSGLVSSFSSRGPVKDGRIKPEISADGENVISTWPGNTYASSSGTSMASPAVTGGLALLYQRYRQLNGGADPKSALIKALACNGATDRGNAGPDFSYGFGTMNLLRSVEMMENHNYIAGNISNNITNTHMVSVPPNTAQLKVMLYWHDPAAAVIAARTLVNDLDLEVADPFLNTVLPKVPDTAAANLALPAAAHADHINNMEQVVINSPAAGNYTIRIKGTAITQAGPQEYFLVYDPIPVSIKLTYPVGGEALVPGESIRIHWDSYGDTASTFGLQYSADNGATWINIATGLNAARRIYTWTVPAVATNQAMVRVIKESVPVSSSSNPFVIIGQPVISLAPTQCEGYAVLNWTTIPSATDYEIMWLQNTEMVSVATTSLTGFTFSGLNKDSVYWFSVRARINGKPGRRAIAISRKPDTGTCAGAISDNDLKLSAIISPSTGRKFTSTQLSAATAVSVVVKNLDDAPASGVTVKYSLNGGPVISETIPVSIPAGGSYLYTFSSTIDLSAVGTYVITAIVKNSVPDPVSSNDTLLKLVRQLDNPPINLNTTFFDDLEAAIPATYTKDSIGLAGIDRYDYHHTTSFGRLRTFVNSGFAHSGSKAITMDIDRVSAAGNINYLIATFNLANYNATVNDLRLDFYFMQHGQEQHDSDKVWIRGNDLQSWIPVYDLYANQADPGIYKKSLPVEISRMLAANSQNFSSSFQVRWGQFGKMPAADKENGAGYTIDDIRLFTVNNDIEMVAVNEPVSSACGLGASTNIKVTARNSSFNAISNVPVRYRINNGAWISEIIPVINANTSVIYTFNTHADVSAFGTYIIEAIVDYAADSFHENDTVRITVINSPVINSFPYLENFENGKGYWFSGGKNATWEFGTPSSVHINRAASGTKAWKTRLAGNYNDLELSYLYSPCFDISAVSNPTLSFSAALDIEDCGTTLCDAAWIEYSTDGLLWTKLGAAGQGFNWYNKTNGNLWSIQDYWRWHVATIPLPVGLTSMHLRFVFASDQGVNREGIAIDDIHIYDNSNGIYNGATLTASTTQTVPANQWTHLKIGTKNIASVFSKTQPLGITNAAVYIDTASRWNNNQYYHPRNITLKPSNRVFDDSISIRFYFTDKETEKLLASTGCSSCSKPTSAYDLGVSKYKDTDTSFENGNVSDDQQGTWTFIKPGELAIVPYDIGYYAEFKVKDLSEFWLNNGGLDKNTPLPVKLMEFFAKRVGSDVLLTWKTGSETDVMRYEIEVAKGDDALQRADFIKIGEVVVTGNSTITRQYSFADKEVGKSGTRYYRLKIINTTGSILYSAVRPVVFDEPLWQAYPNPSDGLFFLLFRGNSGDILNASVYDSKGSIVKQLQQTANGFTQKLEIDLRGMSVGIYLLRADNGNQKQSFKLYKNKG
jgi:hypothetical protein